MRGITEVYYVTSGLGKSPAATNRKTGALYINIPYWEHLPFEHKLYVLLHEEGHIVHDTSDEFLADKYAFEQYVKMGYSLTEAVYALSKVLTLTTDEHIERIERQLNRALIFDFENNKNGKAGEVLKEINIQQMEGFNLRKSAKKALKFTPHAIAARTIKKVAPKVAKTAVNAAKKTPIGLLVSNRKQIAKTAASLARVTPLGIGLGVSKKVAKSVKKRIKATPERARELEAEPLMSAQEDAQDFQDEQEPPETHWSEKSEEEIAEDEQDGQKAIDESEFTDEFNKKKKKGGLKKVFRKVGDAIAPALDKVLKNSVPGGNAIANLRSGLVDGSKSKKPQIPAGQTDPQGEIKPPSESKIIEPEKKDYTMVIVGVIFLVVVLLFIYLIATKKLK